jgi:hypothetical protein
MVTEPSCSCVMTIAFIVGVKTRGQDLLPPKFLTRLETF